MIYSSTKCVWQVWQKIADKMADSTHRPFLVCSDTNALLGIRNAKPHQVQCQLSMAHALQGEVVLHPLTSRNLFERDAQTALRNVFIMKLVMQTAVGVSIDVHGRSMKG